MNLNLSFWTWWKLYRSKAIIIICLQFISFAQVSYRMKLLYSLSVYKKKEEKFERMRKIKEKLFDNINHFAHICRWNKEIAETKKWLKSWKMIKITNDIKKVQLKLSPKIWLNQRRLATRGKQIEIVKLWSFFRFYSLLIKQFSVLTAARSSWLLLTFTFSIELHFLPFVNVFFYLCQYRNSAIFRNEKERQKQRAEKRKLI